MTNLNIEKVLSVYHWTDTLFSFTCSRNSSFRFLNGQFTMVGLPTNGKPLLRAYSMVSANYEENLEFLSIKIKNGPLTSQLQNLKAGDSILIGRKPTGTLIIDNLLPGKTLWLISTGTGLAPFISLIKSLEVYESYERVVLTHTCRFQEDLAYQHYIINELPYQDYIGKLASEKLIYYPTVTREQYPNMGRITDLIISGKLFDDLNFPLFSCENDRIMLCGNPYMIKDVKKLLIQMNLKEGNRYEPGHFVIESAFIS